MFNYFIDNIKLYLIVKSIENDQSVISYNILEKSNISNSC